MNADMLLMHFERISEAPDAVTRLRRFILDLAVRGKLVEQDPNDEPAAELLKRIQAEKARLVKDGRLKKTMAAQKIESLDNPFDLPSIWAWSCLGDVAQYGIADKVDSNKGITVDTWVLDLEDIEKDTSRLIDRMYSSARPFLSTKTIFKRGDVLFGKLRPYLNKVLVADQDGVCTTEIIPIRGYCGMAPEYMKLVLKSPLTMARVDRLMYGMKMPRLGTGDAVALSFPLPPLAEQHRIVAKVDELMALCDQLQAAQNEREAWRDRLVAASLHRIGYAVNPSTSSGRMGSEEAPTSVRAEPVEAFVEAARFHLAHLPRLTTRPEHIKQLRQAILNLAVRGRLVPQDPNDEPAVELLKLIGSNKARFVKTGAIRNVSTLAKLTMTEEPFSLPQRWIWVRLGSVGYTQTGTTPPTSKPECFGGDTPFVTPSDLSGTITTYKGKGLTDVGVRHSRLIQKDSVLMVCIGSTIGKTNVVDREVCCNQQINTVTPFVEGMTSYFSIALRSAYFQGFVFAKAGMGTLPILSKGKWELLPIPLPPLAEQHRIVAKVDELMTLCDQLEAQLTTTQTDSRRLLEAVLHGALSTPQEEIA
jgi:type I restriction enzyme S subunit